MALRVNLMWLLYNKAGRTLEDHSAALPFLPSSLDPWKPLPKCFIRLCKPLKYSLPTMPTLRLLLHCAWARGEDTNSKAPVSLCCKSGIGLAQSGESLCSKHTHCTPHFSSFAFVKVSASIFIDSRGPDTVCAYFGNCIWIDSRPSGYFEKAVLWDFDCQKEFHHLMTTKKWF